MHSEPVIRRPLPPGVPEVIWRDWHVDSDPFVITVWPHERITWLVPGVGEICGKCWQKGRGEEGEGRGTGGQR